MVSGEVVLVDAADTIYADGQEFSLEDFLDYVDQHGYEYGIPFGYVRAVYVGDITTQPEHDWESEQEEQVSGVRRIYGASVLEVIEIHE